MEPRLDENDCFFPSLVFKPESRLDQRSAQDSNGGGDLSLRSHGDHHRALAALRPSRAEYLGI
jgi:hypothetical protein